MKRIPEEYIHYIWQYGLYDQVGLRTTEGLEIEILKRGFHNSQSGPDFTDVRLKLGEQEWVGHVEIHYRSKDWYDHGHQYDPAYNNVILHVVLTHDIEVRTQSGGVPPTLSLAQRFSIDHFRHYDSFITSKTWVPCEKEMAQIGRLKVIDVLDRMISERLEQKSQRFLEELERCQGNWEQVVFMSLAMAMGAKVNAEPFRVLTLITPLEVIKKHRDDPFILEALFLGQAGFLTEPMDDHARRLSKEYDFLKHKYGLQAMTKVTWKLAPVRPASAPQVRIVQLSRLFHGTANLFSLLLEGSLKDMHDAFDINLDGYWQDHHSLAKPSKPQIKRIGQDVRNSLFINVAAVLRFSYAIHQEKQLFKDSAVSLLETIPSEENTIIRKWREIGVQAENAMDSQALIQLKREHCDKRKCLTCSIGKEILK
ncbi:MAG: DUF2851 family protein [Bacteroidetes bacterium]|nr:DUF2851 family protein [Bacteroidota bacterium]